MVWLLACTSRGVYRKSLGDGSLRVRSGSGLVPGGLIQGANAVRGPWVDPARGWTLVARSATTTRPKRSRLVEETDGAFGARKAASGAACVLCGGGPLRACVGLPRSIRYRGYNLRR